MSKALRRIKEQMEIEFLKGKTYTEINEMFNQMQQKLNEAESKLNKLNIGVVMPCFEFSNKATKYTENGVTTLAVDTDGLALTNDNLPHQAYTLEEGVKYTVKLYKA